MPESKRDHQKNRAAQAINDLDRVLVNLRNIQHEYQETMKEWLKQRELPGGEFLEQYRPNYDEQLDTIIELATLTIMLQDLIKKFREQVV